MKQNYHVNANTNSHSRAIIRCADIKLSGFTTLFPPFKNHTSEHIRLSDKQIRLQIIPIFQSLIRRPYLDFFSKSAMSTITLIQK